MLAPTRLWRASQMARARHDERYNMARIDATRLELEERMVQLNRVSKVVKGGRRFSFSSVIVVGDGRGIVGAGMGKAAEVTDAIRKGVEDAKKNLIQVPMVGTTIPHDVIVSFGASKVMLRPASPGTGVIAGGAVRAVLEAAGIKDVLTKSLGNNNPVNVVRATLNALQTLRTSDEIAQLRGLPVEEMARRARVKVDPNAPVATAPAVGDERLERPRNGRNDQRGGGRGGRGGRRGEGEDSGGTGTGGTGTGSTGTGFGGRGGPGGGRGGPGGGRGGPGGARGGRPGGAAGGGGGNRGR